MIKAVLWDFGGVLTSSPFEAFARYEEDNGLPADFIRGVNATNPDTNAWARLERSEVSLEEFDRLFAEESIAMGHRVGGLQVIALLGGDIRPSMVEALRRCKERFKVGCITNNIVPSTEADPAEVSGKAAEMLEIFGLFDHVIESSKIGVRKPDPRIYKMACEEFGVLPGEAVYLDDLGINLKPARALGMTTIKVVSAEQALDELEAATGLALRG